MLNLHFSRSSRIAAPLIAAALMLAALACSAVAPQAASAASKQVRVTGLVYGDNSFELYVNGRKVASDPIAFKPFNVVKVSFRASYPMTFAFKGVDYGDAKTGLEYDNTKAGDGGLIARFSNGVVTGSGWKATTISHGPTDLPSCLADPTTCKVVNTPAPSNWTTSSTSSWPAAKLYTEAEVQPHVDGFSAMKWGKAKFIWGDNLVTDNIVLLRKTVTRAVSAAASTVSASAATASAASVSASASSSAQLGKYNTGNCAKRKALFPMKKIGDLVKLSCKSGKLYIASNSLPHHEVLVGISKWNHNIALPQDYTGTNAWHVPLTPVRSASPVSTLLSNKASGVALNGVPIFAPTRQDGTSYSAMNDPHLIGELDNCGGHAGRAEDYHYHYGSSCLIDELGGRSGELVGYGLDGYPILGLTEPDGSAVKGLDNCHGHYQKGLGYHYHLTTTAPYVMNCYHGKVDTSAQPFTNPMRGPDAPGMVGTITGAKAGLTSGYASYRHSEGVGKVTWTKNSTGCWTFNYTNSPSAYKGASSESVCAKSPPAKASASVASSSAVLKVVGTKVASITSGIKTLASVPAWLCVLGAKAEIG